jgi:hypothetical protein
MCSVARQKKWLSKERVCSPSLTLLSLPSFVWSSRRGNPAGRKGMTRALSECVPICSARCGWVASSGIPSNNGL